MKASRRALLLLALATPAASAETATLDQVMRGLAAIRERSDRFTEEKTIPELEIGLPNEGRLLWRAPDHLEKHTTWPIEEKLTVQAGRLRYERADRDIARDFALAEQPEMQALVEAIRGTLAGDLATLQRFYEVEFEPLPEGWRLVLVPKSLRLLGAVQRIVITGAGDRLRGVDTEGNGGTTRMRIQPGS